MSDPIQAVTALSLSTPGDRERGALQIASATAALTHRGVAKAANLLKRLFAGFDGRLALRLWNGTTLQLGKTAALDADSLFTLVFHHPGVVRSMVLGRDALRLAEAYFRGDIDVEGGSFKSQVQQA